MKIDSVTIAFLVVGPLFLWMGIRAFRHNRWRDGVPAIELAINRMAEQHPPPRNLWDRRFALFQAVMSTIFGALLTALGLAFLYSSVAE